MAIDAKADGSLTAEVIVDAMPREQAKSMVWTCEGQILDLDGKSVAKLFSQSFPVNDGIVQLATKLENPRQWTAETPNLYQIEVRLKNDTGDVVHTVRKNFGFRTIEIRNGENPGVFVNGQRIMLKGCNRHSFWPDSGRCLSEQISHDDVALIKDMNMNAVRMSHYPPDQHFLDECDKQGLYVLDELAGWHASYDATIGHQLVEAMVKRDLNHPCILFWDNGNEGGWNARSTTTSRSGICKSEASYIPGQRSGGSITAIILGTTPSSRNPPERSPSSRPKCSTACTTVAPAPGLEDYWNVMIKSRASNGGFIWAFLDEDVKRTDKNGILDSRGNEAPDGIIGPYREKEGSFYAIKELWSPVLIQDKSVPASAMVSVENRYSFTDLKDCRFKWEERTIRSRPNPFGFHGRSYG